MSPYNRRLRSAMVMTLVLSLVVTACVSGEPDQSPGEASQGVTDETIKIGMFGPMSGPLASFGKPMRMHEAYYRWVNEQGGINGRQLELVIEDSQCDATKAALTFRDLFDREEVFMFHAGMCSNPLVAILPEVKAAGIPFLVSGAATGASVDPPSENVFATITQRAATQGNADLLASYVASTGNNRVGVITHKDEWGIGWYKGFMGDLEPLLEERGLEVDIVSDEELPVETGDTTGLVSRLLAADPDILVVYGYPQPFSVLLRDMHAVDLDVPVITGLAIAPEDQVTRVQDRTPVEQVFASYCQGEALDSSEMDFYRTLQEEYFPRDVFDSDSIIGLEGAELNVHVLKQMGDELTWENYIRTMEEVEFDSPLAPATMEFGHLDPDDPDTRQASKVCKLAVLDPAQDSGRDIVLLASDWEAWLQFAR